MSGLKIISWNINGLRAIAKKNFTEWLAEESPDIVCVQEIKAMPEQVPENITKLESHKGYYFSAERKGYSGVAIFTKDIPQNVIFGLGSDKFDKEGRVITLEFDGFSVINSYHPNGRASIERLQYKMDFYAAFLEMVNKYREKQKNIIICGDFNTAHSEIDLARPKENSNVSGFLDTEREWMDRFVANGYIDSFRMFNKSEGKYTWWDPITRARERNVGWRIDYCFVTTELASYLQDGFILNKIFGSDHCPTGIILNKI